MQISVVRIFMATIFILIGSFFVAGGWQAYKDFAKTKHYTGLAIGHLTKKHLARASDGNTIYYVDYYFRHAGSGEITATSETIKQVWDLLKEGDRMEIRYDPADPQHNNFPVGSGGASLIYAVFIFVLGMVFLSFGISRLLTILKRELT
ncbi:MAG TPA: DUF3592 domain-containing protein [Smithellaceae bacterium]|nr:DUF3592 domain-containing protein [Smithellaceae bacterium]HRS89708.1 DUF3592 domain-containing protein [Smithellaceae bacterium]HRV26842.1 DUF3592 domain-containing protein [Smithellaceae bacterium]